MAHTDITSEVMDVASVDHGTIVYDSVPVVYMRVLVDELQSGCACLALLASGAVQARPARRRRVKEAHGLIVGGLIELLVADAGKCAAN